MGAHKMPRESEEPGPGDGADSEPQPAAVGRRRFLKTAAIGGTAVGLLGGVSAAALATGRSSNGASAAGWGGPGHPGHDGHGTGPGGARTSAKASASASSSASASKSATAGASESASAAASTGAAGASTSSSGFVHPGLLHTQADLDRMKLKVAAGAQPWLAGWNRLVASSISQSSWKPNPQAIVYRGSANQDNYGAMYYDIHAAYQNGLRYHVSGDTAHAEAAVEILNAWSARLTEISGDADRFIAAGIYGYQFANAAELVRDYPGFELERFQQMMLRVFYPLNDSFLTTHNGSYITNYWGSWDELSYASVLAIGILCEDSAKVDQALTYFQSGAGNGSILHAVPHLYTGGLGQWVEAGRDQGHATLGIGLTAAFCQMAWNQGHDMYGYADSRFLAGAEYVAQYSIGQSVPYTTYTWFYGAPGVWSGSQTFTAASPDSRGNVRPIWEMIYNHYVVRQGLSAPALAQIAASVRPEGGGSQYGGDSGGFDQLGFGTLAYTL
jgi:Alginate lyase